MKTSFPLLSLALLLLLPGLPTAARPRPVLELGAALAEQRLALAATATGLGGENLTCTFSNRTGKELRVRVPAGLHFAAADEKAQDLFTCQERLLVLAANQRERVHLRAFCMERHDYAPRANSAYTLRGLAGRGLQPLGDSLQKYPGLVEDYGQLFVWTLTDGEPLRDVRVAPALQQGATNVLRYLSAATGHAPPRVLTAADGRPSVKTFSRRVTVLYHNPTAQVATLRIFDRHGRATAQVFGGRRMPPGVVEYTFGLNAVVGIDEVPAYTVRLLGPADQVLQEVVVTEASPETDASPALLPVDFAFTLARPTNHLFIRLRLADGTLVEELAHLPHLPAGSHRYHWAFHHLQPAGTALVARLETKDGQVLHQQPLTAL